MLNSASTRLACLEDVEVDVSATGSPARLFRRRVFAPEDNRDERFLTASDVVKVCVTSLESLQIQVWPVMALYANALCGG